ncbi:S-adenosyl-L-methionine-dependent methyltransferase [Microdochium bolleyi]|uniref:S-adenosyl-L-methionine-dependent methyltransferase n=1 Tax=Microdochium bolleyi TaxID=196109 RepID=A0A136IX31_9PEZI|nr:S-adenosyl-L-methionine-dependent methyltransferase [Microdochium bolleyi]
MDSSDHGRDRDRVPSLDRDPKTVSPPSIDTPTAFEALSETIWDDDTDSALGEDGLGSDDDSMSTASLSDSILEYRRINGRTYHNESRGSMYWGPNDEQSNESLDISHQTFLLLLDNKLFLAPLQTDRVRRVLDIGTGTGMWANDFADEFPAAEVTGTDISPIQAPWTAPNCRFEMEDAEKQWTYPRNSFDYIHMRTLCGAVQDWQTLFTQAYDTLAPGGWLESYETEATFTSDTYDIPADSPLRMWTTYFKEAGKRMGRTFNVLQDDLQVRGMTAAGFKDIRVVSMKSPIGPWSSDERLKKSGAYAYAALENDLEGYIVFVWTEVLRKSLDELRVFLAHFRKAIRAKGLNAYLPQRIVYAQKPLHGG